MLPISPNKYKRILYYDIEAETGYAYSVRAGVADMVMERLKAEGFEVDRFEAKPGTEGMMTSQSEVIDNYDLIIYLANMVTKSNQTVVRIEWKLPMGANVPVFMHSVPTIFIFCREPLPSAGCTEVRTFINTYNSNDNVLDALMDKLMGRSELRASAR